MFHLRPLRETRLSRGPGPAQLTGIILLISLLTGCGGLFVTEESTRTLVLLDPSEGPAGSAALSWDLPGWPDDDSGALPQETTYMGYEPVTTIAPPEVAPTADVYRLELKNLFPDGDFEQFDAGDTVLTGDLSQIWQDTDIEGDAGGSGGSNGVIVNSSNFSSVVGGGESYLLDGNALRFSFEGPQARAYTNLDLDQGLIGGYDADALYLLHFDLVWRVAELGMELNNGATLGDTDTDLSRPFEISVSPTEQGNRRNYPADFRESGRNTFTPQNPDYRFFSFGGFSAGTQDRAEGEIDNFAIIEGNRDYYLRAPITYGAPEDLQDRPTLLPGGSYTVSIWIHRDPAAGRNNRFSARRATVGIDTSPELEGGEIGVSYELADLDGWREIEATIEGPTNFDSTTGREEVIFELVISPTAPTDPETTRPGSILISAPALTYSTSR